MTDKKIINESIDSWKNINNESLIMIYAASQIIPWAYKKIKNYLKNKSEIEIACKSKEGNAKEVCRYTFLIRNEKARYNVLRSSISMCKDENCKNQIKSKLNEIANKIKQYKYEISQLQ